jgi:hypothetical protein
MYRVVGGSKDGEKVLRDLMRNKIAANATGEREIGQFQ